MTNTIRNADKDFDFSQLHLGNPHALQGGSYFSKILFGPTDEAEEDKIKIYTICINGTR